MRQHILKRYMTYRKIVKIGKAGHTIHITNNFTHKNPLLYIFHTLHQRYQSIVHL